jgi:hypothetical protein
MAADGLKDRRSKVYEISGNLELIGSGPTSM